MRALAYVMLGLIGLAVVSLALAMMWGGSVLAKLRRRDS